MNLRELLEHTSQAILRDQAVPRQWKDPELTLYLNEAEVQFARRTHCLTDGTSGFTFVETEAGVATYTLDPRVIFILEIVDSDGIPLMDRTRGQISRRGFEGKPRAYTTDAAGRTLRLFPTPDDAYTLDLLVARKPLAPMVEDDDTPEIDEEYHLALCAWAAYRALRNNDPDGSNVLAADTFRTEWELAVRDAKRDVFRLRAGNNPTARANWTGKR